jgi:hypothetical protein
VPRLPGGFRLQSGAVAPTPTGSVGNCGLGLAPTLHWLRFGSLSAPASSRSKSKAATRSKPHFPQHFIFRLYGVSANLTGAPVCARVSTLLHWAGRPSQQLSGETNRGRVTAKQGPSTRPGSAADHPLRTRRSRFSRHHPDIRFHEVVIRLAQRLVHTPPINPPSPALFIRRPSSEPLALDPGALRRPVRPTVDSPHTAKHTQYPSPWIPQIFRRALRPISTAVWTPWSRSRP